MVGDPPMQEFTRGGKRLRLELATVVDYLRRHEPEVCRAEPGMLLSVDIGAGNSDPPDAAGTSRKTEKPFAIRGGLCQFRPSGGQVDYSGRIFDACGPF